MPSERAGLSAVDFPDLSKLHTPLSSRRVRDRVEQESPAPEEQHTDSSSSITPISAGMDRQRDVPAPVEPKPAKANHARSSAHTGAAAYPSLSAAPREHLIPYSVRLPLSQIDALDKICRSRNIDKSNLVRDFIAAGLQSLGDEIAALG